MYTLWNGLGTLEPVILKVVILNQLEQTLFGPVYFQWRRLIMELAIWCAMEIMYATSQIYIEQLDITFVTSATLESKIKIIFIDMLNHAPIK
jgi:hypothetical protein